MITIIAWPYRIFNFFKKKYIHVEIFLHFFLYFIIEVLKRSHFNNRNNNNKKCNQANDILASLNGININKIKKKKEYKNDNKWLALEYGQHKVSVGLIIAVAENEIVRVYIKVSSSSEASYRTRVSTHFCLTGKLFLILIYSYSYLYLYWYLEPVNSRMRRRKWLKTSQITGNKKFIKPAAATRSAPI